MNILKTDKVFGLELKLMLLGINLLLLLEVNAARHNLLLLLEVNAARHNLLLLLKVNAARHKLITSGEQNYDAPLTLRRTLEIWKRVRKSISRKETPLFPTMVVQNQAEMGKDLEAQRVKDTEIPQSSVPNDNVAMRLKNEKKDDRMDEAATTATSLNRAGHSFCTTLQTRVLALETIKTTQANEIDSLKRGVKRLEKKDRKRTYKLKRLYKVSLTARVESSDDTNEDIFGVNDLDGDKVLVEIEVVVKDGNLSVDDVNLAQALSALKSAKVQEKANVVEEPSESITKTPTFTTTTAATTITAVSTRPRAKGFVIHEQEQAPTPTVSSQQPSQVKVQDKGKGIMVEEPMVEQVKPIKRLEQIRLDEELESSSKRAGDELEQESSKKQKLEEDKESEELKQCLEIILDDGDDVTIDATPLSTKSSNTFVDYKDLPEWEEKAFSD
ncbi:hypothetical protein Tco_0471343 [Tanacetum coccineum]